MFRRADRQQVPDDAGRADRSAYAVATLHVMRQTSNKADMLTDTAHDLRSTLVATALAWERRYGVAPAITSTLSEYDAARLVGHTDDSFSQACVGRTAVTRGSDFVHAGLRYQVKACRPSGKPGSAITMVPKAGNYDWDRLIWVLYDRHYVLLEAWQWEVDAYRGAFDAVKRISPAMMRAGRALHSARA